ncbi:MAG: aminopeptidase [Candidatus Caldatribacteriota bacterium]|nr:aminopeptidase [Candidatus Caldatribacteriota bacterium]
MEKMFYKFKNAWEGLSANEKKFTFKIAEEYKKFLDIGKTERECASEIISLAKTKGFKNIENLIKDKKPLKEGMKIYASYKDKTVALFVVGKEKIENGMNIVGSHIDSPRLDLKASPLYEDAELALLKTHYYGGIKKYQWTTIPLSMHGVIVKKDGTKISIAIGEDEDDPVFVVSDILPHLGKDQAAKKMSEGITGEQLNVIIGNIPLKDKKVKEHIKLNILNILKEKYGMDEDDFISAEIEIVPAGKAKDTGLDRSLILAYGHDDRICAFSSLKGILEIEHPQKMAVALFTDKEEIGSVGNTGMHSAFFDNTVAELIALEKQEYNDLYLRRALSKSKVLSADVNAGFDPNFPEVFDKKNSSYIGKGIILTKFTGSRGKSGANDAHAEFVSKIKKLFTDNKIVWQASELGKVDVGGGGTIAYILANKGADVLDCGAAVLNMHSPFELISKVDLYMAYKAYKAFMQS